MLCYHRTLRSRRIEINISYVFLHHYRLLVKAQRREGSSEWPKQRYLHAEVISTSSMRVGALLTLRPEMAHTTGLGTNQGWPRSNRRQINTGLLSRQLETTPPSTFDSKQKCAVRSIHSEMNVRLTRAPKCRRHYPLRLTRWTEVCQKENPSHPFPLLRASGIVFRLRYK